MGNLNVKCKWDSMPVGKKEINKEIKIDFTMQW